jgi:hypothetical protein
MNDQQDWGHRSDAKGTEDARQAYAIVRIDLFQSDEAEWRNKVTVKEIVWSQEVAEAETRRLNELNEDKGCLYFWQTTRVRE